MSLTDAQDAVGFYDRDVEEFAQRYDAVAFEAVHAGLIDLLPPRGAAVLDVGAGSGRDARALAARGFKVTAVEPSGAFRERSSQDRSIVWIDDRLPKLACLRAEERRFAFILCSAVLMLLPDDQLPASLASMALVLEQDGVLAINLRGPVPDEPVGLVHCHSDQAIVAAAEDAGLRLVRQAEAADALGRVGHCWRTLIFSLKSPPRYIGATAT